MRPWGTDYWSNNAGNNGRRDGGALNARAAQNVPGWLQTQFGPLRLQAHQINVSKLLVQNIKGLLLFYKVGSGKTLAAISAAENLAAYDGVRDRRVVVILPASLKNNFLKEMRAARVPRRSRYVVVSFHKVHRLTREQRARLGRNALLIIDEVQNLRNPDNPKDKETGITKRTMLDSTLDVARTAHKRLLLSATPTMNYAYEIGSVIALLDPVNNETQVLKRWTVDEETGLATAQTLFKKRFGKHAHQGMDVLAQYLRCQVLFYEPPPSVIRQHYPTVTERVMKVTLTPAQIHEHFMILGDMNTDQLAALIQMDVDTDPDLTKSMAFLSGMRLLCNSTGNHHAKLDAAVARIYTTVNRGGRCVVFSSFLKLCLHKVRDLLAGMGVPCVVFDGNTADKDRPGVVQRYNDGSVPVILLSDAGKEGLDLKNTSQVHIMEPQWNEEKVKQAIGRAVRFKSHTGPDPRVGVFRYVGVIPPSAWDQAPPGLKERLQKFAGPGGVDKLLKSGDVRVAELSAQKQEYMDNFTRWLVAVSDRNLRECITRDRVPQRPLDRRPSASR